jgi:hypothetical protein
MSFISSRNDVCSDDTAVFQATAHDLGPVVCIEILQSFQGIAVKRDEWIMRKNGYRNPTTFDKPFSSLVFSHYRCAYF